MHDFVIPIFAALGRTTICMTLAACIGGLMLRMLRAKDPFVHRVVWSFVLLQGCLLWQVPLPLLPGAASQIQADKPLDLTVDVEGTATSARVNRNADETSLRVIEHGTQPSHLDAHSIVTAGSELDVDNGWNRARDSAAIGMILLWLGGMIVLAGKWAIRYREFLRWSSDAQPAIREWQLEWDELLRREKVSAPIPLLVHDSGPVLCRTPEGYRLIVPAGLWVSLTSSARKAILLHELEHYLRNDIWKSFVVRVLSLPQWFNPFARLAVRRFEECAEWACDDAACRNQPGVAAQFARSLLSMVKPDAAEAALSSGGGTPRLTSRIQRLLSPSIQEDSLMKRMSVFTLVAIISLAGVFRIVASETHEAQPHPAPTRPVEAAATSSPANTPASTSESETASEAGSDEQAAKAIGKREFKFDVAYVDIAYLFEHSDEFRQSKERQKEEIDESEKIIKKLVDEIQQKENRFRAAETQDAAIRLQSEVRELKSQIELQQQEKRDEFLRAEARIYSQVFSRIQAEVAQYATELSIREVRRLKEFPENKAKPGALETSQAVIQRINRDVIYQADERFDITHEILKRLNQNDPK